MDINLDLVPTRQKNMLPYEILLSESQERMLVVVHKGKEQIVKDIFKNGTYMPKKLVLLQTVQMFVLLMGR